MIDVDAPGPGPVAPPRHPCVPLAADLRRHAERTALIADGDRWSYQRLADEVDRVGSALAASGPGRRLVLIAAENAVQPLVHHLAALAHGHVPLLVPGGDPEAVDAWVERWSPDVVVRRRGDVWQTDHRPSSSGGAGPRHDLHPELALLLTTSGSTGSPRLVRLSQRNVQSNADAIAQSLRIGPDDVAATTLPMAYCYGLSVVHSHLQQGAAVVLTDRSVVDPCFWELVRAHRVTTFAGVPHTFDLLDRTGFDRMHLPHLRYLTQAGGALPADQVRRWAAAGRERGWQLVVMYGQTEATARMAYLPAELAHRRAGSVGRPVPGGSVELVPVDDVPERGIGELVYRGPNVMLGYAERPGDLALGRTVHELRTGDLARRGSDGLLEIVGRRSRFAKVFGLRVDLDRVEARLHGQGLRACCVEAGGALGVLVEGAADVDAVRRSVAVASGLPPRAVQVVATGAIPRRPNGKPDPRAAAQLLEGSTRPPGPPARADGDTTDLLAAVVALYAELLERPDAGPQDSFVGLGGDSLSYVEVSLRLEDLLATVPQDWHVLPVADLVARAAPAPAVPARAPRRHLTTVGTDVVLRAVAVLAVVASHADLVEVRGGAHVLLGVAGYNLARFHLTDAPAAVRARRILASARRVAVPAMLWIGVVTALTSTYSWHTALLLQNVLGSHAPGPDWRYWFVESLVYLLLGVAVLVGVRPVDRWERRAPFAFPLAVVALGLLPRYGLVLAQDGPVRIDTPVLGVWLFGLGWAAARARSRWQRWTVTAVVLACVPGFFAAAPRTLAIVGGLCLLIWVPTLPWPRLLVPVTGLVATASLYIYLVHWQVYPLIAPSSTTLAVVASVAVGVAYRRTYRRAAAAVTSAWRR